jgi:predicted amidohydrolase
MARTATTSTGALGAVLVGYSGAVGHYQGRAVVPLDAGRLVGLAVTDTLWRALAIFSELAAAHGVWLAVTTNVADAERVTDPSLIDLLVDEAEADRSFAWQATGDEVPNQTLVFGPDGTVVHRWRKAYLVPIEEATDGLALSYGSIEALRAFDFPFGRAASVISKDAWMPDVIDRLALEGTSLMLQPEAFSGWGVPHGEDAAWAPDVVKESGWAHVMRYPEMRASVLPCLSHNLAELVFDCQSTVIVAPPSFDGTGAWVGQDPDVGFAAVAPWLVLDDGLGTLEERRARIAAEGARLLPGGDLENGYAAGTVAYDLDLARAPRRPDGAVTEVVAPSEVGEQRRPVLVWAETRPLVLFEDDRHGTTRIYGAFGEPAADGFTFGEARVRVRTEGEVRMLRAAWTGDAVHLVWQEARGQDWDARYAVSADGGRSFGEPITLGSAPDAVQLVPDVAVDPADGTVWVSWIDLSDGPSRVLVARRAPTDVSFGDEIAIEPPASEPYATRQNRWGPTIAARDGRVVVAWTDFRSFAWEIWGAFGDAFGFGAPVRLDDADVPFETVHADPRAVILEDGAVLLAWTDLRERRANTDVRARRIDPASVTDSPPSISLASSDGLGRPQWRPSIAFESDAVVVVWQDLRVASNELRFALSEDGGRTFGADRAIREDGVDRYSPAVAARGDRILVTFETLDRGPRRVSAEPLP